MLEEQQQDGHLLTYEAAQITGKPKRIFQVNGVASDVMKQRRDLEALVWLTLNQPFDIVGIHNSTQGLQADLLESMLGKTELSRLWSGVRDAKSQERLQGYANFLKVLCTQTLAPDADILQMSPVRGPEGIFKAIDLDLLRRLTGLPSMTWDAMESYLYGPFPPGAPRSTLRLAYEVVNGIRAGAEVFIVAHSQGLIITALALHIVQQFFGDYANWSRGLRIIGYGPAILFEDLPQPVRSQTILLQHRQDLVAESFSNIRTVDVWRNLQTQAWKLVERANELVQIIGTDSHHSASFYLGLTGDPAGDRSARMIQRLLLADWGTDPLVQSLQATRIILEDLQPGSVAPL